MASFAPPDPPRIADRDPFDLQPLHVPRSATPTRLWIHILLLILTSISTSAIGARLAFNFDHNLPTFDASRDFDAFWSWASNPTTLISGLPFSLTLMTILLAHEFGHYFACRHYGINASLPYFLPAPTFTGTFGAFIRIRSMIGSRRQLFDIGVAGPLAGFVFIIPALGTGIALSKAIPGIASLGGFQFGTPLVMRALEALVFPGYSPADIYVHPVARAAWIGIFATALNLLPAGQLDGGHILYALFGRAHRYVTLVTIATLAVVGAFFWHGWLLWSAVLAVFARRHPPVYDSANVGASRLQLGLLALILLVICCTVAPVQ